MKLNRSFKSMVLILGTGLVGLPVVSHAELNWRDNWYAGGSLGQAYVDEAGLDDEDLGFKVFGGYQFNKYLGAEIGYVDLGELEDGANALEADGFSFGAVGTFPIPNYEKFAVRGKAGVYVWDLDTQGAINTRFSDDSDNDLYYGVGASYQLTQNVSLIGEWERYEIQDFDVDLLSVGISYRF